MIITQALGKDAPEYRFECRIIDTCTDETVISANTYISDIKYDGACESVEMELFSMLRAFDNKVRERYEAEHYPQEESND